MKQASFVLAALISAALLVAGCSKSADTSSNTSASEGSAASTDPAALSSPAGNVASAIPEANPPSPDADASAPVNVTSTDDGASFTQGNKSASFGKGSADDIKASGLPLYPGIDPAATTVIKSSDSNAKAITVSASTTDDFAKVDAWYASQLGSDYKASRLDFGGAQITTFKKDVDDGESSVLLTASKDPKDGQPAVAVMLVSKSKP